MKGCVDMKNIMIYEKERLWSRDLAFVLAINFFAGVIMHMLNSTMPLYVDYIGGSRTSVGIVTGIFALSALFFRPIFGNIIDSKSRKLVLFIGIIVTALVNLSYIFVYSMGILIVLRIIHGIGASAQTTAVGTIVADVSPKSRLSEGVGLSGITGTIATAVGPALGLYIVENHDYNIFFLTATIIGIIAIGLTLFVNYEKKNRSIGSVAVSREDKKKAVVFEKSAVNPSIVVFFIFFTFSSIFTFLTAHAKDRGIENLGIFFTVYAIAFLAGRVISGRLSGKLGINRIIILGLSLMILSFTLIAVAQSLLIISLSGVVFGIGYSLSQPALNTIAVSKCTPDRRGAANATFFAAVDSGFFLGAILWGVIGEKLGSGFIYIFSALFIVIALIFFTFLVAREKDIEEKPNELECKITENI